MKVLLLPRSWAMNLRHPQCLKSPQAVLFNVGIEMEGKGGDFGDSTPTTTTSFRWIRCRLVNRQQNTIYPHLLYYSLVSPRTIYSAHG